MRRVGVLGWASARGSFGPGWVHTGGVEELRALHDAYVWQVNAAVGEDRMDLVWQLADEYLERALQVMCADQDAGCGRVDCSVCTAMATHTAAPPALPVPLGRRLLDWAGRLRAH